jgi:hypothetical protein
MMPPFPIKPGTKPVKDPKRSDPQEQGQQPDSSAAG